jgi:hypothetical protein
MPAVEIRMASAQLAARMEDMRRWLQDRGCAHKLTSTGSSEDRVVVVEFLSAADADDFARRFGGILAWA